MVISVFVFAICCVYSISAFVTLNGPIKIARKSSLKMLDIPYIPAIIASGALVFAGRWIYPFHWQHALPKLMIFLMNNCAVFNIDNKVDLTDQGLAEARRKKRLDRIARGESERKVADPSLDPYRYKWFEEDDSDDFEVVSRKKGGGCG